MNNRGKFYENYVTIEEHISFSKSLKKFMLIMEKRYYSTVYEYNLSIESKIYKLVLKMQRLCSQLQMKEYSKYGFVYFNDDYIKLMKKGDEK